MYYVVIIHPRRRFLGEKTRFPSGNLTKFSKTIYKIMNKVGDNIILTGLNYELFYKSILKLSDCFEGIMYKFNQKCISRKTKEYSKMEMKSSLEMYQLVEPFISNDYQLECGDYL